MPALKPGWSIAPQQSTCLELLFQFFESGFEISPVMFKFILIPSCADSKQKTAARER